MSDEVVKKPKGFQKKKKEEIKEQIELTNKEIEKETEVNEIEEKPSMPEVVQIPEPPKVVLSPMAEKWRDYLNMQRLTPERFLEKYPVHPSKKFVEEILRFNKNTD